MATRSARPSLRALLVCAVALVASLMATPTAHAQDARQAKQLLEDFNHYVFITNLDLAEANGQALLDMGLTPTQFLALVEDSANLEERFDEAYQRALQFPQIEGVAVDLYTLYNDGIKGRVRSITEIRENIELLGGDKRQRFVARLRLVEAKEYAVPELLEVALNDERIDVRNEAAQLLVELGRSSAVPLSIVLPHLEEEDQERVARILGNIPHSVSVPALYQLWAEAAVSPTREAARQAIVRLEGRFDEDRSLDDLFRAHSERYYNDRETGQLLAFPGEEHQLLWSWRDGIGLYPDAIRSEFYHEAMSMRSAEAALSFDENDEGAIALWLAANISRQIDQPADYDNPAYSNDRPDADFYAAALGHGAAQRVLDRALDDKDVRIARRAIEALRSTAGDSSLRQGVDAQRPLIEALAYPDRRVSYDAALALAEADPRESFAGAERVVPTLAGMITQAGKRYALVIANEPNAQQDLRDALRSGGYDVLPPIASLDEVQIALANAPGVDLIVADLPGESLLDARSAIRRSSQLGAAPLIALGTGNTLSLLDAENDSLTRPLRRGVTGEQIVTSAEQLTAATVGAPLDEGDALYYAGFALGALRDLAVSRNPVLNPSDASATLLEAIAQTDGFVRVQIAEVLSYIDRSEAQRALADAAADAFDTNEQANMLNALASSARRFGNMLEERHEVSVVDLATGGDPAVRQSAANAAGALGLSGQRLAPILMTGN